MSPSRSGSAISRKRPISPTASPARGCSKRMRQHIVIAQSLVNDPEFLILDEPTSGLDAPGRYQMQLIIQELKRRGKTILLCSHFLAEVEEVCNRIGVL